MILWLVFRQNFQSSKKYKSSLIHQIRSKPLILDCRQMIAQYSEMNFNSLDTAVYRDAYKCKGCFGGLVSTQKSNYPSQYDDMS